MRKFLFLFLFLIGMFALPVTAGDINVTSLTVTPELITASGTTVTINVSFQVNTTKQWGLATDEKYFWVVSLSKDSVWGSDGSQGINMGGGSEPIAFNAATSVQFSGTDIINGQYNHSFTKTLTFKAPDNSSWGNGSEWYVLIKFGGNVGSEGNTNPNTWKLTKITGKKLTVATNKFFIFNTAWAGDKSSRAELIIVEAEPPKQPTSPDVWLTKCKYEPANKIQKFGEKQSVEIKALDFAGGDILYYFISKELIAEGDSLTIKNQGKSAKENVSEEIKDADIVYVGAYVTGGEKEPSVGVWKFVRDTLKAPTVNNYAKKFSHQTTITLNSNNETSDLCDFEIRYTTDGSDPLTSATAKTYNNGIQIDKSTTLKIVAVAYNRIHSPESVYEYILATDGNGAYFDTKGKGGVDKVVINTTIPVKDLPESAQLTSPFKNTDKKTISKSEMRIENDETIIIEKKGKDEWIFPPENPAQTNFETSILAQLFGDEYGDDGDGKNFGKVTISDEIAPVPIFTARYVSGKIDKDAYDKTGEIKTDYDTLTVTFSESTRIIPYNGDNILAFSSNKIRYGIRLIEVLENNNVNLKFKVELIDEKVSPAADDTLYVFEDKIKENKNVGVTQENETSVPLTAITSANYLTIIKTVTPVVAGGSDPTILVDFIKKSISPTDRENLNIGVKIIDATGNIVAELDGFKNNGNISAEIAENALQIRIRWNGKNRSGRSVGAGAYLAVLSITGPDGGAPETVFKTIGVGTKR
ncbi:MAG: chitobiase/beta-hexosaminidase C-terminal domain-containing protein [Chitinivibrionia bacterium]|nr:chitobiase/beta-hexosaminidase C-terminal domain-containing protein [Chitinivibrionia bacterium]